MNRYTWFCAYPLRISYPAIITQVFRRYRKDGYKQGRYRCISWPLPSWGLVHCLATRNASFASLITTSSAIATPPRLPRAFSLPSLPHLPACLIFRSPSTRTTQGGATWPRGWARLDSSHSRIFLSGPQTNRVDFGLHSILEGETKVPRTSCKWRSTLNVPGSTRSPQVGCAILSRFSADCGLLCLYLMDF